MSYETVESTAVIPNIYKCQSYSFNLFFCLPTSLPDQEYHVSQFCKTMKGTPERSILHFFKNRCKATVLWKVALKSLWIILVIGFPQVNSKAISLGKLFIFLGFVCEWSTNILWLVAKWHHFVSTSCKSRERWVKLTVCFYIQMAGIKHV